MTKLTRTNCPNCNEDYLRRLTYNASYKEEAGHWKNVVLDPRIAYCPNCDSIFRTYYIESKPSTIGIRIEKQK